MPFVLVLFCVHLFEMRGAYVDYGIVDYDCLNFLFIFYMSGSKNKSLITSEHIPPTGYVVIYIFVKIYIIVFFITIKKKNAEHIVTSVSEVLSFSVLKIAVKYTDDQFFQFNQFE